MTDTPNNPLATPNNPPAGWYAPPAGDVESVRWRYWDGQQWTLHASPEKRKPAWYPDGWTPPTTPCHYCGTETVKTWKRDKALWHACFWVGLLVFGLTWLAIPFLPKRPYCARCGR